MRPYGNEREVRYTCSLARMNESSLPTTRMTHLCPCLSRGKDWSRRLKNDSSTADSSACFHMYVLMIAAPRHTFS